MNADLSLMSLISEASLLVQIVMLILLLISVYSWTIIFKKRSELADAPRDADLFEDKFWLGNELISKRLTQSLAKLAANYVEIPNQLINF